MADPALVALPDPTGTSLGGAPYCTSASWAPDGAYLACAVSANTGGGDDGGRTHTLVWLRRTGRALVRLPTPDGVGACTQVAFSPSGEWLAVTAGGLLRLLHRVGDTLTLVWTGGACNPSRQQLCWVGDEHLLAPSGGFGYAGLHRRTGGALSLVWGGSSGGVPAMSYDYHPGTGLIVMVQFALDLSQWGLGIWQRTGDSIARAAFNGSDELLSAVWHAGGELLFVTYASGSGDSGIYVDRYTGTFAYRGDLGRRTASRYDTAFLGIVGSPAVDPAGMYVAAGNAYDPATYGSDDPGVVGLSWVRIDDTGAGIDAVGGFAGDTILPPPAGYIPADVTEACRDGSTMYLLASVTGHRYGFVWYAVGPPASRLHEKQPDGSFALVGTEGRPHAVQLADGSWRTWPGSPAPLDVRLADGTFRRVIG